MFLRNYYAPSELRFFSDLQTQAFITFRPGLWNFAPLGALGKDALLPKQN